MFKTGSRHILPLMVQAAASALMISSASAAITVTNATITGGKLQVSGNATVGTSIKLDDKYQVSISTQKFSFSISNYHPDDCVVTLKTNSFPTDPAVDAVVANCGIRGLTPRGAWLATNAYKTDDTVSYGGAYWRAKKAIAASAAGSKPGLDKGVYWEKVAAKGARGLTGPKGAQGDQGPAGPQGPKGDAGTDGAKGAQGDTGPAGPKGAAGADGVSGMARVTKAGTSAGTAASYTLVAACPTGKQIVGGGAMGSDNATIRSSYPSSTTQWTVVLDRKPNGKGALKATAYANCAVVN